MITEKKMATRGEVYVIKLGVQEAEYTRDAVVKSLYEVSQGRGDSGRQRATAYPARVVVSQSSVQRRRGGRQDEAFRSFARLVFHE